MPDSTTTATVPPAVTAEERAELLATILRTLQRQRFNTDRARRMRSPLLGPLF